MMATVQRLRWAEGVETSSRTGSVLQTRCLRRVLLVLLCTSALAGAAETALLPGPDPSLVGLWEGPYEWPVTAIHAFLLPTGKVLHFDFPGTGKWPRAWLWDPTTWEFTPVPVNRTLFCGGHSFLADGRLLITGGDDLAAPPGQFWGIRDTHIFDPFDETWTRVEDMAKGRWYPTNVTLADGRVLVFSGFDETGIINTDVEIYDPGSGTGWQVVTQAELPLYPAMQVLSSGDVFYSAPSQVTGTFEVDAWGWYGIVWSNYGWRGGGMSVPLPPGPDRAMIIGGEDLGVVTETAEIIDLGAPFPSWRYTDPMNFPRMHGSAVILPDGKILVVGGHSDMHEGRGGGGGSVVYEAEMFDPQTEAWSVMAPTLRPRVYHSTAILLPDARVLAGGSDGEFTTEIYSPPYLFRGPRPVIAAAPARVPYGESFGIRTSSAPDIESIVLIRLSSMTHSVNMDQRYVALSFSSSPGPDRLTVDAPPDASLAPPGYYMLFLVDTAGVPSVSRMVQLGGRPGDLDGDGDVDLTDFTLFAACFGLTAPNPPGCPPETFMGSDLDGDGDVDLADFVMFAQNFTG